MTTVFVDSFFWFALLHPRDAFHSQAVAYPLPERLVTSAAVMLEVLDGLSAVSSRPLAAAFWQRCCSNPRLEIVSLSSALLDAAAKLYADRPDKNWSLTDCTSFVVMSQKQIELALTGDKHFEQAGFRRAFSA